MIYSYNNFKLSDLGDLSVSQSREYEGGDAPQRCKVTHRVTLELFERSYDDNYSLVQKANEALRTQQALLVWQNEANSNYYVNQTATLAAHDLPEEWGQYHQTLHLVFFYYEQDFVTQNLPLTFTANGIDGDPVNLQNVTKWSEGGVTERYSPLHSQRKLQRGKVGVGGFILGDPTLPLDQRRAALVSQEKILKKQMTSAEGTLIFGAASALVFNQVVRIEEWEAEVDQPTCCLRYTFSATYTLFPNESDYALMEFSAEERDPETGELFLKCSGKIIAPNEGKARTAMDKLLAGLVKQYGYDTSSQQLSLESTAGSVQADVDGTVFLELSFNGEWKKWRADNQPANFQRTGGAQAVSFGNVNRWGVHYSARRYGELHSQRQHGGAVIEGGGTWAGDPALPLEKRRAQLLAQQQAMLAEINNAEGKLVFGVWNQVVRMESFKADINQAITAIDWSFSAAFTMFPNETNYALSEFTAEWNDSNPNAGEQFLTVAGKITAQNETAARAKMDAVVATVLANYKFVTGSQKLNFRSTASTVSADTDGETFLELSFTGEWRQWSATNQKATFQRSGQSASPVDFGNVMKWNLRYAARRFTELRSQREQAGGTIEAAGTWAGDAALSLDQRRTQLLALQQKMLGEVNNADGALQYGAWSQTVRVENFKADINQSVTGIDWSFTAIWTLFPNEPGYATAEFSTDYQGNVETGDAMLTLEGRIFAPDETLARAELARIRAGMLVNYGFTLVQQLRTKATASRIYANGDKTAALGNFEEDDGTTFTELAFSEEYRQRLANIMNDSLQIASRDDTASNQVTTTYSGTVTASGDTDVAYALALQRAQTLGANKESTLGPNSFLRSSQISWDQRRTQSGATPEFVRLTFTYEYQGKLATGRAYVEMATGTTFDTFGTDTQTVSGFVAAADSVTAQQIYQAQVRSGYKTALVHNETVTQSQVLAQAGQNFPTQFIKLDFNFQIYQTKPAGRVAFRYGINVRRDFLALKLETHIKGSIFAFNRPAANAALANLLKGVSGAQVMEELNEDREYMSDLASNSTSDVFMKLDFDEAYEDRLTGITGVLEMTLSQQVKYSGTRWIPQPLPFDANGTGGLTVVQPSGIQEGGQTIRGSVTAPDQATAIAWAKIQRTLLVGTYPQPEEWDWDYEFVPRIQGVVKGANPNVRLYKLNFTFGEILPNYPPP